MKWKTKPKDKSIMKFCIKKNATSTLFKLGLDLIFLKGTCCDFSFSRTL